MLTLYPSRAPKLGLAFDFETSGSAFGQTVEETARQYQAVSLGLAIFNTRTFDIIDELYFELQFDEKLYKWSAEAEAIHGLSREYLAEHGLSNEEAVEVIIEFLLKYFGPNPTIMVLGHNVHFDIAFMEQLLVPHGLMFHIYNVKLDTASAGFINFITHKSNDLFELSGIETRGKHNALDDVRATIQCAKFMRDLVEYALVGNS